MIGGIVASAAFGAVITSFFALLILEVIRERRPGARWWQVLAEIKAHPMERPLFLATMALLVVVGLSVESSWPLALSMPVYGYLGWYLRRNPRFGKVAAAAEPLAEGSVAEPASHVQVVRDDGRDQHR